MPGFSHLLYELDVYGLQHSSVLLQEQHKVSASTKRYQSQHLSLLYRSIKNYCNALATKVALQTRMPPNDDCCLVFILLALIWLRRRYNDSL